MPLDFFPQKTNSIINDCASVKALKPYVRSNKAYEERLAAACQPSLITFSPLAALFMEIDSLIFSVKFRSFHSWLLRCQHITPTFDYTPRLTSIVKRFINSTDCSSISTRYLEAIVLLVGAAVLLICGNDKSKTNEHTVLYIASPEHEESGAINRHDGLYAGP